MPRRPTFFDSADREAIVARLRDLRPDAERRWGKMTAPEVVAHLIDQMTLTLGIVPTRPRWNMMRLPGVKHLSIYWMPWPRGAVKGPPEAFVTAPASWSEDLERLIGYVGAFSEKTPEGEWPVHLLFGRMSGEDWGVFCHKHFDHHLRQFGV
jgi:hypothetical protein